MAKDWTIFDLSDKTDLDKMEKVDAADNFRACMAVLEPDKTFDVGFKNQKDELGNPYVETVPITWTSPKPHCAVQITCGRGGIDLEIFCSRRELVEKILRIIKEE